MRRALLAVIVGALFLAGCSSSQADDDSAPMLSAGEYYGYMRAGSTTYELFSDEDLDSQGRALCSDLDDLEGQPELQRAAVLVVGEHANDELSAFGLVLVMTGRHCPRHVDLWDEQVREITGEDELPWD